MAVGAAADEAFNEPIFLFALIGYGILVWTVGFNIATVTLLAWMLFSCARMRPVTGIAYGALIFAAIHGLMVLMKIQPPLGVLVNIV